MFRSVANIWRNNATRKYSCLIIYRKLVNVQWAILIFLELLSAVVETRNVTMLLPRVYRSEDPSPFLHTSLVGDYHHIIIFYYTIFIIFFLTLLTLNGKHNVVQHSLRINGKTDIKRVAFYIIIIYGRIASEDRRNI